MMNSEPDREVVLKVLKQAYVPHNGSIEKVDRLVGNVIMDNYISFSDDEIPLDGHGSTKALHIITRVKVCTLPKVFVSFRESKRERRKELSFLVKERSVPRASWKKGEVLSL